MSTNIQLLRSAIAYKRPAPSTLLDGQAAVNLNPVEPGLFFKLSDGALSKIGPVCVNTTGVAPNATPSGSSGNAIGESWLDGRASLSSPVLKVWNGTSWQTSNGFTVDDTNGNFSFSKQITARNYIASGTGAYSWNQLPKGPTTDETSLILSPQSGYVRFNTTTAAISVYDGTGWAQVVTTTPGGCSIVPGTDNTCDLGAASLRWANLFAVNITLTGAVTGSILPSVDNTYDLGSPSKRFANVYTGDLHLQNERGSWTMIEEETYLSLRNNKTGKTYRLAMEEVDES